MHGECRLDHEWINIVATTDDEILRPPAKPDIAVGVDRAEIAGVEPLLSRRRRIEEELRSAGGIEITRRDARSADRQNTHGAGCRIGIRHSRPERHAARAVVRKRDADRAEPRLDAARIEYEPAVQLRHAPTLTQWHPELLGELASHLDRDGGTSGPAAESRRRLPAVVTCHDRRRRGWRGTRKRDAMRFDEVPEARDDARVTIAIGTDDNHRLSEHQRGEREDHCARHMEVRHTDRDYLIESVAVQSRAAPGVQ